MPNKISVKMTEPIYLSSDGSHHHARKWQVTCTDHPWIELPGIVPKEIWQAAIDPGFWGFDTAWRYAELHIIDYHPRLSNRGRVLHPEDDDRDHRNVNYPETWRF